MARRQAFAVAFALGAFALAASASAQTPVKLVGNTNAAAKQWSFSVDFAQAFTTGSNSGGYRLTRVDLLMKAGVAVPVYTVKIHTDSSTCNPATRTSCPGVSRGTLTNPSWPSSPTFVGFLAPAGGIALAADTKYWLVIDVSSPGTGSHSRMHETDSDDEDSGKWAGWSIADSSLVRVQSASAWGMDTTSLSLAIHGHELPAAPSGCGSGDGAEWFKSVTATASSIAVTFADTLPGSGTGHLRLCQSDGSNSDLWTTDDTGSSASPFTPSVRGAKTVRRTGSTPTSELVQETTDYWIGYKPSSGASSSWVNVTSAQNRLFRRSRSPPARSATD